MNSIQSIRRLTPITAPSALATPWPNRPMVSTCSFNNTRTWHRQFSASPPSSFLGLFKSNKANAEPAWTPELSPTGEPLPYYSPHKPKRQWPPDMTQLSEKHQFRLERKYRRRAALKWERPRWKKGTKLVQYGLIGFVLIYALFFMEWDEKTPNPVGRLRTSILDGVKNIFFPPPPRESLRKPDHGKDSQLAGGNA